MWKFAKNKKEHNNDTSVSNNFKSRYQWQNNRVKPFSKWCELRNPCQRGCSVPRVSTQRLLLQTVAAWPPVQTGPSLLPAWQRNSRNTSALILQKSTFRKQCLLCMTWGGPALRPLNELCSLPAKKKACGSLHASPTNGCTALELDPPYLPVPLLFPACPIVTPSCRCLGNNVGRWSDSGASPTPMAEDARRLPSIQSLSPQFWRFALPLLWRRVPSL